MTRFTTGLSRRLLIALAVALTSCSGSQSSGEGPCLPINDWQIETRLSLSEESVAALAWRPAGDPYASEQTLWPALGNDAYQAASLELQGRPNEPVAVLLVPEDALPDDELTPQPWTRAELDEAAVGSRLSGGAILLARMNPRGGRLALQPPLPSGRILFVRLVAAAQRSNPVFVFDGSLHLTWSPETTSCTYSAPQPLRSLTLVRWSSGCGNGITQRGEACDDGNRENNDGCSHRCEVEPATCPADAPPASWDSWSCDNSREPSLCTPRRCTADDEDPACERRHPFSVAAWVHGRNKADAPVARVLLPSLDIECDALDGASRSTSREACERQSPPCAGKTLELELAEGASFLGWRSRERQVYYKRNYVKRVADCGPRSKTCVIPDDGPLEAAAVVQSPHSGVRAVQLRHNHQKIVAAPGGGFFLSTNVAKQVRDDQGREITQYFATISLVDANLHERWRHQFPARLGVRALASDHHGGVVAAVNAAQALQHQSLAFEKRGYGLIALDENGAWRFGRHIGDGPSSSPQFVAVEPGKRGRIALFLRDTLKQRTGQGSSSREVYVTGSTKLRIFDHDGQLTKEISRPWNNADGLLWTAPGKLLIFADGGNTDQVGTQPLALPEPPQPPNSKTLGRSSPELMQLLDANSGQAYWTRQWRTFAGWTAQPALGDNDNLAFILLSARDPSRPEERGRIASQYARLVVIDATTGDLRWSHLLDNPRSCRGARHVAADPRNGDWIALQPQECAGRNQYPTALLIERLSAEGTPRWTEVVGSTAGGAPSHEARDRDWPTVHSDGVAVSSSGLTAIIGHGGHVDVAGERLTGDSEHFIMVVEP